MYALRNGSVLLFMCIVVTFCWASVYFSPESYKEVQVLKHSFVSNIVNGFSANHERPFYAMIRPQNVSYYCGASIIHPYWIITAAECVQQLEGTYFEHVLILESDAKLDEDLKRCRNIESQGLRLNHGSRQS